MTINSPRLLLAKLRKGDYAHAGEGEAIDLVLNKLQAISQQDPKTTRKKILDVGCGLGGTAEYVRNRTSDDVYGIDIDEYSLNHAKKHYPDVKFFQCDVQEINTVLNMERFDIIYLFNVFYALQNQKEKLELLARVSKPEAILAIVDYTQPHRNSVELNDLAGIPMNPIYLKDLLVWLERTGWDLIESVDISDRYKGWYADFLKNLREQKVSLLQEFSDDAFNTVEQTFSVLLEKIQDKQIGGGIIYVRRRKTSVIT